LPTLRFTGIPNTSYDNPLSAGRPERPSGAALNRTPAKRTSHGSRLDQVTNLTKAYSRGEPAKTVYALGPEPSANGYDRYDNHNIRCIACQDFFHSFLNISLKVGGIAPRQDPYEPPAIE
jgi:hypothetical protein